MLDTVQSEEIVIEIVKAIKRTYDLAFDAKPSHDLSLEIPSNQMRLIQQKKTK